jgi:GxxExxY protein
LAHAPNTVQRLSHPMQRFDEENSPETHAIIGALFEVHKRLRNGFLETVYQESLAIELRHRGIPFERECRIPINYRDEVLQTVYRADFVCYGNVLIEMKAITSLGRNEESQIIHYLRATGLTIGILVNFGSRELEFRRFVQDHPETSSAGSA